ncbi:hypothetical protein [Mucilaginibacter rubeus]|uniref:Uncharacterized protein n=1 Tax=Mucilaginibacter rubeus TaxID=2027860 RepID=A0A5C1I5J0_9SPHI|nr:hypothetical protein [Mucilaginibacter rubeus]QEM12590.1 hypothetical protein DEO27_022105 [Mucilaginibacter rubeus]
MSLFADEAAMQKWLHKKLKKEVALADLIFDYERYKSSIRTDDPSFVINQIRKSYLFCMDSFDINELLFANENISLNPKDILKPDFVLYAAETQSIVIVELKNLKSATRQAGTEVGAYAAEIKSYLPFMADGEVVNVIISSDWPVLLRHYVMNEIIWLNRNVICLEPLKRNGRIGLAIVSPDKIANDQLKFSVSQRQLGGFHLCLYDYGAKQAGNFFRMDDHQNRIRTALNAMAARGNALRTHGFAFLFRVRSDFGEAPYIITIVNFSSFQGLPFAFLDPEYVPNKTAMRFLQLLRDNDPEGHGQMLNKICEAGEVFLKGFCDPRPEDFRDWGYLKEYAFHEMDAMAFTGWGVFEEMYFELLAKKYDALDLDFEYDNPMVAISMLNEIVQEIDLQIDWEKLGLGDDDEDDFFE